MKKQLAAGTEKLGKGYFAFVYTHKRKHNTVIKIGLCGSIDKVGTSPHNDGYLAFLKKTQRYPKNPFFPKVHSIKLYKHVNRFDRSTFYYVIEMEKLVRFFDVKRRSPLLKKWFKIYDTDEMDSYTLKPSNMKGVFAKQAAKVVRSLFEQFHIDIHEDNYMWRVTNQKSPQLVITDPAA